MYAFSRNVKLYKNAINRAINMYFMFLCILICISLELPDNNHVKVKNYLTNDRKPDVM